MIGHTGPKNKIRCFRGRDPVTGTPKILHYYQRDRYRISLLPDRISRLPDEIQTLILNFLPIKQAFQTSALSKKWRHLCYSLPSLSFDSSLFGSTNYLIKMNMKEFIDQVLSVYNGPCIDYLCIVLNDHVPHNHMDEWVSFAASHHVQTFILWDTSTTIEALYTLPSSIFSCASLKVVRMKNMRINFPTDKVFLPRLEYIELSCCCFTDAVFSTCNYPMLGKLVIHKCQYDKLSISSSALYHLMISKSVGNPKNNLLSIPNLSYICYYGENRLNISLGTLSSLQHAYFVITEPDFRCWNLVGKIVKGLRSVRDLEVGTFYVECLRVNWDRLLLDYPVAPCFSSVKSLKLVYSGKRHVPVLKVLLRSYPNLEFLRTSYMVQATENDNNTSQYWDEKEKERLPTNFLNSLVTYEVHYTRKNEESEFELMKFIVENATALRNINICLRVGVDMNEEDVSQKLKTFSQKGGHG